MKKMTQEIWSDLWNKALDVAMCEAIPESILDSYTRSRLTSFLCDQTFQAGRQNRNREKSRARATRASKRGGNGAPV